MTPAIALLTIGLILLRAGWKNQNIVDVILGRENRRPGGNVPAGDSSDGSDGSTPSPRTPTRQPPFGKGGMTTQFDGHPVASWIVPILRAARKTGLWHGSVTSGYRSDAEQQRLWNNRGSNPYPVAPPGTSNHGKTLFPGGAVDVSDPNGLAAALKRVPMGGFLKQGTAIGDAVHFSNSGR